MGGLIEVYVVEISVTWVLLFGVARSVERR